MCVRSLRTQQRAKSRCQIILVSRGGFALAFGGCGVASRAIPLVEMDGLFTSAFVQPDHRALLGGAVFADVGTVGRAFRGVPVSCCSSTESLILAQDERWRRA